jgi:hypothetical protein
MDWPKAPALSVIRINAVQKVGFMLQLVASRESLCAASSCTPEAVLQLNSVRVMSRTFSA